MIERYILRRSFFLLAATVIAPALLIATTKRQTRQSIHNAANAGLAGSDLAGCAGVAGRHVQAWVLCEEVARAKESVFCQQAALGRLID